MPGSLLINNMIPNGERNRTLKPYARPIYPGDTSVKKFRKRKTFCEESIEDIVVILQG